MQKRRGFTLVELLVVIGIIALLISILLPSLNRARQSAVSLDCMARMRQMGQAVHFYANENKGLLPPSFARDTTAAFGQERYMATTLSRILGKEVKHAKDWSPIFRDQDVPEVPVAAGSSWEGAYNHYNWNLRLFPAIDPTNTIAVKDPQTGTPRVAATKQRPIASVKNASEVVAGWDGQLVMFGGNFSWGNNAFYVGDGVRGEGSLNDWVFFGSNGFVNTSPTYDYRKKIGHTKAYDGPGLQGHVDWRHNNRTSANVLFLDGHVESRRRGELTVGDFCTNPKK